MSLQDLINKIFFGADGRVRSGWRFVFFLIIFLFLATILVGVSIALMKALPLGYAEKSLFGYVLNYGLTLIAAIVATVICGSVFESLPIGAHGFGLSSGFARNLAAGSATGVATIAFAVLLALIFGGISLRLNDVGMIPVLLTTGTTLVIFIVRAALEEVLFRGYMMQTFFRSELALFGVVLTSLLFATTHNNNPGANPLSWGNTLLAGIWLAVCYVRTKDLWFAFGVHLMWNWFQGSIFGINVSGLAELTPAPLMRAADNGPQWLTGGEYGLEGGIACTVALIVSTAAIWFWPSKKP